MTSSFLSFVPSIHNTAFVHSTAQVIGRVTMGRESSVWCNAVVRGDVNTIIIGDHTNIQDNCVLHVDSGAYALNIGDGVTVGHSSVLHGCTIEHGCLIGIGAIVLNGAVVGSGSLVAAGAIVPEGAVIPPGSVVMGVPGKVRRPVSTEETKRIEDNYRHYVELAERYKESQG